MRGAKFLEGCKAVLPGKKVRMGDSVGGEKRERQAPLYIRGEAQPLRSLRCPVFNEEHGRGDRGK